MSAALNGLGHQLLASLGPLSIELAAVAGLVLAVGRLIRSPALRHLLWLAVLVKPLIALVVSSPYTILAPLAPLAEPGWDAIAHERVEHLAALAPAGATTAWTSATLAPAGWAALLWLVGTTLLSGRILIGYCILRRLRRQAQVQRDGPLFAALRQARATLHYHPRGEVATSPSIHSPMVLGILRPLIVVPTQVVERLSPGKLSLVLMHELAHVRRCDNLALLVQRLVTAALFFHPAVWLCARMLRRESEQACDDLVVCATGRPEAYARGLALVAEGAAHSNPSSRRFPVMSTLAATESDLSQRIRRTLDGRARRMGMRARLLAVVVLSPLTVVTLPSCGTTSDMVRVPAASDRDEHLFLVVDQNGALRLNDKSVTLDSLRDELQEKGQLGRSSILVQYDERTPRGRTGKVVDIVHQAGLVGLVYPVSDSKGDHSAWKEATATDPDEWSEELKARLLALEPGRTIEELAEMARQRRLWRKEMEGRGIGPELLEQMDVLGPEANMTVVDGYTGPGQDRGLEAAKRQIQEAVESGELTEVGGQILREAVATDPEEWSDELKTKLLTLKPDQTIEQIAESFRDVRGGSMIYGYSVRTKSRYERESLFLVDQDGNMKLNHKPVTFATLGEELKKQRSLLDNTPVIIIQIDTLVSHAQIVEIRDIARQAGLVDQVIATEPRPGR